MYNDCLQSHFCFNRIAFIAVILNIIIDHGKNQVPEGRDTLYLLIFDISIELYALFYKRKY